MRADNAGMLRAALDLLFPPGCCACDVPLDDGAFCVRCAETLIASEAKARPVGLDAVRSPFAFGGAIADALRLLKFSARADLGERLGMLLRPSLVELCAALEAPLVVPVPLSRQRLGERGYNQAALIALGATPFVSVGKLARTKHSPPQVGQSAAARREAVRGAFAAEDGAFAGRDLVLVDDVLTTGATLSACAEAVRRAGARRVVALTVARALP